MVILPNRLGYTRSRNDKSFKKSKGRVFMLKNGSMLVCLIAFVFFLTGCSDEIEVAGNSSQENLEEIEEIKNIEFAKIGDSFVKENPNYGTLDSEESRMFDWYDEPFEVTAYVYKVGDWYIHYTVAHDIVQEAGISRPRIKEEGELNDYSYTEFLKKDQKRFLPDDAKLETKIMGDTNDNQRIIEVYYSKALSENPHLVKELFDRSEKGYLQLIAEPDGSYIHENLHETAFFVMKHTEEFLKEK